MAEFNKNAIITGLEELYAPVGNEWVIKNSYVLNAARTSKLSIGGSIAMAITRKKAIKIPGDIDLFTDSYYEAESFINKITSYLNNRPNTYYGIMVNNETPYCLEGVSHYVHIQVPFWHKICVMVLKDSIRSFIWNRTKVQYFDDVVKAAKKVTEIDGKERVSFSEFLDAKNLVQMDEFDHVLDSDNTATNINNEIEQQRNIFDARPKKVYT